MLMTMTQTVKEERNDIEFSTAAENRQLALELVSRAKREILIASYDLDPALYSNSEFVDAVASFSRTNRRSHTHVMVWKTGPAVKQGHRLINLAHRLSSSIKINTPDKVHADFIESFMVIDGIAYFRRPLADRFEGIANFNAPIIARDLRDHFHSMWERSTPSSEFRRLGI